MTQTISLVINGEKRSVNQPASIADLCEHLGIDAAKVAVEHNRIIAPRSQYADIMLTDGDELEIVHFVGGGQ